MEAESLNSFIEACLRNPHGLCVTCKGPPGEAEVLPEVDWQRLRVRIKRIFCEGP